MQIGGLNGKSWGNRRQPESKTPAAKSRDGRTNKHLAGNQRSASTYSEADADKESKGSVIGVVIDTFEFIEKPAIFT